MTAAFSGAEPLLGFTSLAKLLALGLPGEAAQLLSANQGFRVFAFKVL